MNTTFNEATFDRVDRVMVLRVYSPGWQKFDADLSNDWMTTIRYSE